MSEVKIEKTETSNKSFDALAVLDKPLEIEDKLIYAFLYNIEQEKSYANFERSSIDEYIWFCKGIEQWLKNGGDINDDCRCWTISPHGPKFTCDVAMENVVIQLMKGLISITKHEFDNPLEWVDGEVDDTEPRLVLSQALIDRYVKNNENKDNRVE